MSTPGGLPPRPPTPATPSDPTPPQPQQPPASLRGRSIQALAGPGGVTLPATHDDASPLHKKLQASLGSQYGLLPLPLGGGETSPYHGEEDRGLEPGDLEAEEAAAEAEEQAAAAAAEEAAAFLPLPPTPPRSRRPPTPRDADIEMGGGGTRRVIPPAPRPPSPPPVLSGLYRPSDATASFLNTKAAAATSKKRQLGTRHVFWTSAETMWGVLIFLRFGWCVGQVGLIPTLGAVLLSAACQFLSASSLSAVATNGLISRSGGAYYMLSRTLGYVICGCC